MYTLAKNQSYQIWTNKTNCNWTENFSQQLRSIWRHTELLHVSHLHEWMEHATDHQQIEKSRCFKDLIFRGRGANEYIENVKF